MISGQISERSEPSGKHILLSSLSYRRPRSRRLQLHLDSYNTSIACSFYLLVVSSTMVIIIILLNALIQNNIILSDSLLVHLALCGL